VTVFEFIPEVALKHCASERLAWLRDDTCGIEPSGSMLGRVSSGVRTVAMSPGETLPRPFRNARGGLSMNRNVPERSSSNNVNVRAPGVCAVPDVLITANVASTPAAPAIRNHFALIMTSLLLVQAETRA